MAMITMDEAVKTSKKDPRELRRLLRNGTLKGKLVEGRWTVDPASLKLLGKSEGKAATKKTAAAKAPKAAKAKKGATAEDNWDGEGGEDGEE